MGRHSYTVTNAKDVLEQSTFIVKCVKLVTLKIDALKNKSNCKLITFDLLNLLIQISAVKVLVNIEKTDGDGIVNWNGKHKKGNE